MSIIWLNTHLKWVITKYVIIIYCSQSTVRDAPMLKATDSASENSDSVQSVHISQFVDKDFIYELNTSSKWGPLSPWADIVNWILALLCHCIRG